jgi:hypothetical protein
VGPNTATNVVVSDPLPNLLNNLTFKTSTGTYDPSTDPWTVPSLPPNSPL